MPYKPKRPCSYPGCPNLTDDRYCEEHEKKANAQYEKYGRRYKPRVRYGADWERARKMYAAEHPFCEECYKRGVLTPVEHVHHIKPLEEGGDHSEENLMSLCRSCHAQIHAKRGDRWKSLPHEYHPNKNGS